MTTIEIKDNNGSVIYTYEDYNATIKNAVENAVYNGISLKNANLEEADLEEADLCGADLSNANLKGAYLRYAKLCKANLEGANLEWADLEEADLSFAFLKTANLDDADLCGVHLFGADLGPLFPSDYMSSGRCAYIYCKTVSHLISPRSCRPCGHRGSAPAALCRKVPAAHGNHQG